MTDKPTYDAGPVPPDAYELRVVACLIEKQRTTPDAYPLSINALRTACNQATNRDPVVEFDDEIVLGALERLIRRRWARFTSGSRSRARKYKHVLDEALSLDDAEISLLCVLMLRGAQTPGELKQRVERLHPFEDLNAVDATLEALTERNLVVGLPRGPGQKEPRFIQLLEGEPDEDGPSPTRLAEVAPTPDGTPSSAGTLAERVATLERELAGMRSDFAALRAELGD